MAKITQKQKMVQEYILDRINSGMRADEMLPTVKEISDALNVSQMTVHSAVNQMADEGILYKIQGKGTFVGKAAGQGRGRLRLSNGKKMIAFISPYIHDDIFMRDITTGVIENMDHKDFSLITKHVLFPLKEEDVIMETAGYADGFIILSSMGNGAKKALSSLLDENYPMVFVDRYPMDIPCSSVCTDNDEAVMKGMKYLYRQNHRKILYASSGNMLSGTLEREGAYKHFMSFHNLEPNLIRLDDNMGLLDDVFSGKKESWPTAVFALFDGMAINICNYLKGKGIRVPEDVSVMGFNDDIGVDRFDPPLTTIAQPKGQIGSKAVKLLQEMIVKRTVPAKYFLEARLVERASVKPARKTKVQEAI